MTWHEAQTYNEGTFWQITLVYCFINLIMWLFISPNLLRQNFDFITCVEVNIWSNRSSHRRCSARKNVHRNFSKFKGKHLCQSLFFNKLYWKRIWHRCFPVNFAKFIRTIFLQNISGRRLLNWIVSHQKIFLRIVMFYNISGVIYRFHLSVGVFNVSFQLMSCQEIFKLYLLTSNHETRLRRYLTF